MRTHRRAAAIILGLLLLTPAPQLSAQDRGGVRTETQERQGLKLDPETVWNILGVLGLLGLLGLRREHGDDSYHPTEFE